jgi:hypothetical protein
MVTEPVVSPAAIFSDGFKLYELIEYTLLKFVSWLEFWVIKLPVVGLIDKYNIVSSSVIESAVKVGCSEDMFNTPGVPVLSNV